MDRVIRLARTMAWLRWRLMVNSLRTIRGLGETASGVLVLLLGAFLAALGVVAAGLAVFSGLLHATPEDARTVLGVAWGAIGLLALLVPVMVGEGRAELAPRRLLQFPVTRRDLFWTGMLGGVSSGANLLWYPAMAATVAAALVSGRVSPVLVLAAGLLVTLTILALQQALLMGVQWIAASRRIREIATVLAIFLFVGLAQLPNLMAQGQAPGPVAGESIPPVALRILLGVAASLPPALGAQLAVPRNGLEGPTGLLGLLLWTGLGLGAAWKLFLSGLERWPAVGAPSNRRDRANAGLTATVTAPLPPDLAGLAAKQLRYILRSTTGRLGLLLSPVLGLIFAFMGRNAPEVILGASTRDAVFLLLCLMGAMYGSHILANRFQWDRGGAGLYFVTPVDPGRVLLGLDLGIWLFGAMTSLGLLTAYVVAAGIPGPAVVISGLLILAGARILLSLAGAVLSILFPSPRDMGASRNRLSLVSAFAMTGATPAAAAVFGLPAVLLLPRHPGLAPAVLLVLLVAAAGFYRLMLPRLGRLLISRREALLAAITSRPG